MATPPRGSFGSRTYDLPTGVYLDIEPMIQILNPFDVPLTGGYGADGRTVLATGTTFEKQFQWQDETLLTPRGVTTGAATTGDTFVTMIAGDQAKFSTGDVALTGAEYLRVTGWGVTANTLTVTRGFNGSTAATVASGALLVGIGTTLPEGSDPEAARIVDRTNRSNFTEIFGPYLVSTSGSEQAVRKYGISDAGTTEHEHQVANRLKELNVAIEQTVLYGTKMEDTTNKWRSTGGLIFWIQTNIDAATTTITEATLLAQMQAAFDAGGLPDRLVVGSKTKRLISGFGSTGTNPVIQLGRGDNGRGTVVDYYDSDFGRSSIILDRWCRLPDAFGFNRDQVEVVSLRPMVYEQLAKTGDAVNGQVLAEKGVKVRRERHAFRFSALT